MHHHGPHHQPPPSVTALINQPLTLKVLDMGLDFRSYGQFIDPTSGEPLLGNVVQYFPEKLVESFEPTIGLLVTVLHLYHRSATVRDAPVWLSAYRLIQFNIIEHFGDKKPEATRYAEEAVKAIDAGNFSTSGADPKLVEKLFILLDGQSGQRGGQCPSQRPIPSQPKGMFCNLHLCDHKCNQEFSCNQLHLRLGPTGTLVKHRVDFHLKLIDALLSRGVQIAEIQHRIKDSLFYAKYGNRVTVNYNGMAIPFFKTLFSADRLAHALRILPPGVPSGILVQQDGRLQGTKAMDLVSAKDALADIEMTTATIFQIYEQTRIAATATAVAAVSTAAPTVGAQPPRQAPIVVGSAAPPMPITAVGAAPAADLGERLQESGSPTGEGWTAAIRTYMREHGATVDHANDALLKQLADAARPSGTTPVTPDGFTPLLREAEMARFDSESSLDGGSPSRFPLIDDDGISPEVLPPVAPQ